MTDRKTADTVTLNAIRAKSPCGEGWEKLLKHLGKTKADDERLALVEILKSNGIGDAIWCLRALPKSYEKQARLFNCDVAEHVLKYFEAKYPAKYPNDNRPAEVIRIGRAFAHGEATQEDLIAAGDAARDAAWAAARAAEKAWQAKLFIKYFGGENE